MEEKVHEVCCSLRTIFSSGIFNKLFHRIPANPKNLGFTLVEILVVIGILGILITSFIVLINPQLQLGKSRDAKRKSELKQIQAALELYRADQGTYLTPTSNSAANCGSAMRDACSGTQVTYLQNVPKDPKTNANYYYCTSSCVASGYRIYTCLENPNDPDRKTGTAPITCPGGALFYVENP